ncbi:enhancer of mRNA-decapping protein 3 [Lingula anatina]|uniref:Enhancer of mRNA-decapping protein 3 n=1 Tax=Lingula anatina TaxID=7574 RepID=A0A2R2MJ81_LINAN|nr:enhancer of mRNA-decapping protein 3 [Lingula anatina]|eukprot:XP_023930254.1 enhancer of mRNA-decapping protein 3 [Lingula anatina]
MSEDWIGCVVSVDCGDTLGTYQGQVSLVNREDQSITLIKAFRNGMLCEVPTVTLSAIDIQDLKILKTSTEAEELPAIRHKVKNGHVTPPNAADAGEGYLDTTPLKPKASNDPGRRNGRSNGYQGVNGQGVNGFPNGNDQYNYSVSSTREADSFRKRSGSASDTKTNSGRGGRGRSTPKKIEGRRRNTPREECFSAPSQSFLGEFDFEKNLALFDKQAVFEEIESSSYPAEMQIAAQKQPPKYRCDENVLQSGPVELRQIKIKSSASSGMEKDYVTDAGLVVPCIPQDLRNKLFEKAEKAGFKTERLLEVVGRSACEMVLQLLGGAHRLNPRNAHQRPTVVVLCGPHMQGAQGVSCARQLANHNVNVILFVPNFLKMLNWLAEEIALFELTSGKKTSDPSGLPTFPVDIIINCLDNGENKHLRSQPWYTTIVNWTNQSKAPVMAMDPPADGGSDIQNKWSMCLGLPLNLPDNCGQIYLCDLGLPKAIFKQLGITYQSPFGHKFVIPLHVKASS